MDKFHLWWDNIDEIVFRLRQIFLDADPETGSNFTDAVEFYNVVAQSFFGVFGVNSGGRSSRESIEFVCPKCLYPQYCPCDQCASGVSKGFTPWVWDSTQELVSCSGCGWTTDASSWEDESINQYQRGQIEKAKATV